MLSNAYRDILYDTGVSTIDTKQLYRQYDQEIIDFMRDAHSYATNRAAVNMGTTGI